MLRWAHRGTESVARPKPFGVRSLIIGGMTRVRPSDTGRKSGIYWRLRATISLSLIKLRSMALTRDHENGATSQSLSRFEAACLSVGVKTSFGQRQTAAFSLTA